MVTLAEISKAVAATSAAVAVAVGGGLITGQPAVWATGGVGVVAAFVATYAAPANKRPVRTVALPPDPAPAAAPETRPSA